MQHRQVTPDPLEPLAIPDRARSGSRDDVILDRVPAQLDHVTADGREPQVSFPREGRLAHGAGVTPLLRRVHERRLSGAYHPGGIPVPELVIGILAAADD